MRTLKRNCKGKLWVIIRLLLVSTVTMLLTFTAQTISNQVTIRADTSSVNWIGGTTTQHDEWLKKNVNSNWISEDYANKIPANAKGTDPNTNKPYIDEWMPDKNLQKLVLYNLQQYYYMNVQSVNDITPKLLSDNLLYLYSPDGDNGTGENDQISDKSLYDMVVNIRSLEGIQKATQLTFVEVQPYVGASYHWNHSIVGNLSDIEALRNFTKMDTVTLQWNQIHDISPLKNVKINTVSLGYNSITDTSPLWTSKTAIGPPNYGYEMFKLPMITLNQKVKSFTTTSFVRKLDGSIVPVTPYYATESNPNHNNYAGVYKSTADGGANTDKRASITWQNLTKGTSPNGEGKQTGFLTVAWDDTTFNIPSYSYNGWVVQPYTLDDTVGNVNVKFMVADDDAEDSNYRGQIIYPQQTLSGKLGDSWNLTLDPNTPFQLQDLSSSQNQTIDGILKQLKDQYGFNSVTASSPTKGTYAEPGADGSMPSVTYTFSKKTQPVVASPVTVKYVDESGNSIAKDQTISGNVDDPYDASVSPYKVDTITKDNQLYQLDTNELPTNSKGKLGSEPITVTYHYKKVSTVADDATVIVNYIDAANHSLLKSQTISGKVGDPYQADGKYQLATITANGETYNLDTNKLPTNVKGKFTNESQFVNYYYNKKQTPTPTPNPTPVNPVNPVNPVDPVTPVTPTPAPTKPSGSGSGETTEPSVPSIVAKKGEAVYSLKKIYLYQNKTFKKADRIVGYAKKPRINRPMFVVTDYAHSKNGQLRYKVRDVNHLSRTAGKKGYITAQWAYVRPVYYRSSHKTLTVINPRGVNEYKRQNLTGKVRNFKQGTRLKVKSFVTYHLTTRYRLTNGHYITGNRKLVILGKHQQVKKIKVKKTIYRYNNANFDRRTKKIKQGTVLKVKKWTYSYPYSMKTFGAKRYQVAGGYVTANHRYVRIVK